MEPEDRFTARLIEAFPEIRKGAQEAQIIGLLVEFRGSEMKLVAVDMDEDEDHGPHQWEAYATADTMDGPEDCVGCGMTPIEALDACAGAVELAESDEESEVE